MLHAFNEAIPFYRRIGYQAGENQIVKFQLPNEGITIEVLNMWKWIDDVK